MYKILECIATMSRPRTYNSADISRQRSLHAASDRYGRTWHPYLNDTVRRLAEEIGRKDQRPATLLDYGCGKGGFVEAMAKLGLFGDVGGYDPAVDEFSTPPERRFDLVTCLDVLDQVRATYLAPVIGDVARLTADTAIFACLTRPAAASGLHRRSLSYWSALVGERMNVINTSIAHFGIEGFERAVILATPR